MMTTVFQLSVLVMLALCAACSASPKINVGNEADGSIAGSGGSSGFAGVGGLGGFDGGDNTLTALITEPPSEMAVEVITISCAGECKQVLAVARGGNAPYTFAWDDGVTTAAREICADEDTTFTVTATDTAIDHDEFPYAAQTATVDVTMQALTCGDAGVDASVDASVPPVCDAMLGGEAVVSDVMGAIVYYGGGATLPAGRYRVSYVDGCMKYGPINWTVHNFAGNNWFLVGDTSAAVVATLPGTLGFGYVDFEECVAANSALAASEFDHAGGRIGVWLQDAPYTDNIAGLNGRNPTWCLSRI